EKFNASGMIVYGVYPDGEKVEINVNDYTYTPQDTLADGDNTITVSYGELSATFTVRAGEGGVGNFDGSKYVSKKLYLITIIAVGGLILLSVILACVIIKLARRIQRLFAAAGISEDGRIDSGKSQDKDHSQGSSGDYKDED
ncbi:MAG: bacterial Ig-like domain-containing protein, partial [Clostridia bacterium]|nr:bacterial Ig-like domain-containing protein [Clostridia bacterium]